ncbi:MAG: hypothetical protein AAF621_04185 [Pseudomonadota bacterium]
MGGILLIIAMVAAYIIIYWSIAIETHDDKSYGLLGFAKSAKGSLNEVKTNKRPYMRQASLSDDVDNNIGVSSKHKSYHKDKSSN